MVSLCWFPSRFASRALWRRHETLNDAGRILVPTDDHAIVINADCHSGELIWDGEGGVDSSAEQKSLRSIKFRFACAGCAVHSNDVARIVDSASLGFECAREVDRGVGSPA